MVAVGIAFTAAVFSVIFARPIGRWLVHHTRKSP